MSKQTTIEKLRQFVAGATEQQAFISEDAIALQGEILAAIDELLPKAEQELKEAYESGWIDGHNNNYTVTEEWFENEYRK